jgi:fibronectin-binding autotransporter adhesin
MKTPASVPRTLCIAAAIVSSACLSLLPTASAQTITDYLGTNASTTAGFTDAENWSPSVPANDLTGSIARFNQTSYANSTLGNNGYQLNGVQFGDGTTATAAVTITIAGAAGQQLRVGTGGVVMNANSGDATINKLAMPQNLTITNNSTSLLSIGTFGVFQNNSNFTGTLNGTGRITFTGVVSNQATGTNTGLAALDVAGAAVTLSNANTFTGGLTLSSGSLILGNNAALGGAGNILTITGGTLDVTAARTTTNNNAQSWNGDFTFAGANTLNLGTGAVTLGGNRTVTVNASSLTVGGAIGDGANGYRLTKAGAGTLVLTGSNTYSGGTTLSSGTLDVSEAVNALGSGTLTLGNGTTLRSNNAARVTYANSMVIDGDVTLTGARTSYSGNIDLGNTTRTLTVENSPTNGNLTTQFEGVISGNAGLVKQGTGILDLQNGGNTFTGDVSLNEGTLRLRTNAIGSAATNKLIINGAGSVAVANVGAQTLSLSNAVDVNANFSLNAAGALTLGGAMNLGGSTRTITFGGGATKTLNGVISNGGLNLVVDSGTVTVGGANTYSGDTTVSGTVGVVNLRNSLALQNSTLAYAAAGGSVAFDGITAATFGGLSGDKALVLSNTAAAAVALSVGNNNADTSYSGGLSGAGSLTKVGSGTLTLSAANSYAGATTVSAGRLLLSGGADRLPTATAVTIADTAGAVLDLGGQNQTIASLASGGLTGNGELALGAGTLTVNGAASGTFAGVITGAGGLVKSGAGTLTLGNASTYAGPTTVTDGQLIIANGAALGGTAAGTSVSGTGQLRLSPITAGITVAAEPLSLAGAGPGSNGTLRNFSGTNTWQGPITLTADSTIGAANGTRLTIDVASGNAITATDFGLTFTGGGTNEVLDAIVLGTGGITKLGGGTTILAGANVYSGATTVSQGTLLVNGDQSASGGNVTVASGATLGGSGVIGGAVSVLAGGIVSPGTSPGTLTVENSFTLANTSILDFELNPANTTAGSGVNDLITGVTDLTLAGILNISGSGDWLAVEQDTAWRLFNYSGSLSGAGLTLGSTPTLAAGLSLELDTSTAGEVNLVVVPEPSAILLALGGIAACGWRLRRMPRGRG